MCAFKNNVRPIGKQAHRVPICLVQGSMMTRSETWLSLLVHSMPLQHSGRAITAALTPHETRRSDLRAHAKVQCVAYLRSERKIYLIANTSMKADWDIDLVVNPKNWQFVCLRCTCSAQDTSPRPSQGNMKVQTMRTRYSEEVLAAAAKVLKDSLWFLLLRVSMLLAQCGVLRPNHTVRKIFLPRRSAAHESWRSQSLWSVVCSACIITGDWSFWPSPCDWWEVIILSWLMRLAFRMWSLCSACIPTAIHGTGWAWAVTDGSHSDRAMKMWSRHYWAAPARMSYWFCNDSVGLTGSSNGCWISTNFRSHPEFFNFDVWRWFFNVYFVTGAGSI